MAHSTGNSPTSSSTQHPTAKPLALISVADRRGLVPFARGLVELGFELIATTGSSKELIQAGIACEPVESITDFPEILDGRVKTLHPKIHGGLLAKFDQPTHQQQLAEHHIRAISVCVVNLYPFSQAFAKGEDLSLARMTELVDIGGPTMIRAAAKNHRHVLPLIDPSDYPAALEYLATSLTVKDGTSEQFRLKMAAKVFEAIARYDFDIARFMSASAAGEQPQSSGTVHAFEGIIGARHQALRYGENPHQKAAFYRSQIAESAEATVSATGDETAGWQQLSGKELSYNNLLDIDASLRILAAVHQSSGSATAVIVKHNNPCGVAYDTSAALALRRAKRCDPRSHFGGVISLDREVDIELANEIREDFAEVIVAPSFASEALAVLKKSANLRLIIATPDSALARCELRSCLRGFLVQESDIALEGEIGNAVVGDLPSDLRDVRLAWGVCAQTKSNAIVLARDGFIIGSGAGQMSRVDSVEVALHKARLHGHEITGAVAASDAFFPFPDGLETLIRAGVKTVIAPVGAKKDAEVLEVARQSGVTFIAAVRRHFRH